VGAAAIVGLATSCVFVPFIIPFFSLPIPFCLLRFILPNVEQCRASRQRKQTMGKMAKSLAKEKIMRQFWGTSSQQLGGLKETIST